MLPQPRPRLKNVPYKNQSLQDILLTCLVGVEVLDIKRVAGDKYNTRLVITIDKGKLHPPEDRFEKRVQFYNRLKLEKILPLNYKPLATVEDTVHELNVFHKHDFNNDDLEIINGKLEAKRTSLGYYSNRIGDDPNLTWDANDSKTEDDRVLSAISKLDNQVQSLTQALSGKLDIGAEATTSKQWTNAISISLAGAVSGTTMIDGSQNVEIAVSLSNIDMGIIN